MTIAGSHSVGRYVVVANGGQGSGRPKRPPSRRKAPTFRCNQGLGSLTGRTPRMRLMDTTIVATDMASHGLPADAPAVSAPAPAGACGVDGPKLTSAGMSSSMAENDPFWQVMTLSSEWVICH